MVHLVDLGPLTLDPGPYLHPMRLFSAHIGAYMVHFVDLGSLTLDPGPYLHPMRLFSAHNHFSYGYGCAYTSLLLVWLTDHTIAPEAGCTQTKTHLVHNGHP